MLSARNKWTDQELDQLRIIHQEEMVKGRKRLWVRVSQRVNSTVRTAKRQAIEYKWKNFCSVDPLSSRKLCKNEGLIELIFTLAPHRGYQQLARTPLFQGIESNIKNIFYSNARSLTNFLHSVLTPLQTSAVTLRMLSDRKFLSRLGEIGVCFLNFRRSSLRMKQLIKAKRQQECNSSVLEAIEQLQEEIAGIFEKMKVFYNTDPNVCSKKINTRIEHQNVQREGFSSCQREMGVEKEKDSSEIRTGLSEGDGSEEKQQSFAFITDDWLEQQCDRDNGQILSFFDWY